MGIYRRPGTRVWWMRYRDRDGRKCRASTGQTDEASALEVYEGTLAALRGDAEAPERGPLTVARYAKIFLATERERGLESARDDAARLGIHALPALGHIVLADLTPRMVQSWVRSLRGKISDRTGKPLAPRTVRHCYAAMHSMCEEAVADGRIPVNPCKLKRGDLPGKLDADPTWRASAVFSRHEVEALISDPRIPEDRRVYYALHLLTGLRPGEGSAARWRDHDAEAVPLGRLTVARAFDRRRTRVKGTKTEAPRYIPVHPTLDAILDSWRADGWAAMLGREPTADDLIIPSRRGAPRGNGLALKRLHQDLARLGMRKRRAYDSRRTFASLTQAGGARTDVVRWLTHPPKDQLAAYTTLPWATLCEAVMCMQCEISEHSRSTVAPAQKKSAAGIATYGASNWRGVRDSNPCAGSIDSARERSTAAGIAGLRDRDLGSVRLCGDRAVLSVPRRRGGPGGRERPLAVAVRMRGTP